MAHFLRSSELPFFPRTTRRPVAAVMCRLETVDGEPVLVIAEDQDIRIVKVGVAIAPLPARVKVRGPGGEDIRVSGQFWVTLETFNPYHLVIDNLNP